MSGGGERFFGKRRQHQGDNFIDRVFHFSVSSIIFPSQNCGSSMFGSSNSSLRLAKSSLLLLHFFILYFVFIRSSGSGNNSAVLDHFPSFCFILLGVSFVHDFFAISFSAGKSCLSAFLAAVVFPLPIVNFSYTTFSCYRMRGVRLMQANDTSCEITKLPIKKKIVFLHILHN